MLRTISAVASIALAFSLIVPALAKSPSGGSGDNKGQPKQQPSGEKGGGKGGGKGTGGGTGGGKNKQAEDSAANRCPDGQVYQCRPNPVAGRAQICACRKPSIAWLCRAVSCCDAS